ncbi:MAG TPA: polyhydroxyalkanoic acid system family protein [Candidatus Paceibacterota bacterium]
MHIDLPHKFNTKEEAIARVKHALNEARPQLGDKATITEEEWQGDTLTFAADIQGQKISGTLVAREKVFDINAKLPLMMRMFEGRIEKAIKAQTGKLLQ